VQSTYFLVCHVSQIAYGSILEIKDGSS
jgi:hypothetical protein